MLDVFKLFKMIISWLQKQRTVLIGRRIVFQHFRKHVYKLAWNSKAVWIQVILGPDQR